MILYLKYGGGGGAVMFFSHFMLFPTFIEKKNLGIQNNYFSFNVVDRDSGNLYSLSMAFLAISDRYATF